MKKNDNFFLKNKILKLNISLTKNNCIICLTDLKGNALYRKSCGSIGFLGAKKKVPLQLNN